jgi:hypothetical protein
MGGWGVAAATREPGHAQVGEEPEDDVEAMAFSIGIVSSMSHHGSSNLQAGLGRKEAAARLLESRLEVCSGSRWVMRNRSLC